jgi:hypothetical protein
VPTRYIFIQIKFSDAWFLFLSHFFKKLIHLVQILIQRMQPNYNMDNTNQTQTNTTQTNTTQTNTTQTNQPKYIDWRDDDEDDFDLIGFGIATNGGRLRITPHK